MMYLLACIFAYYAMYLLAKTDVVAFPLIADTDVVAFPLIADTDVRQGATSPPIAGAHCYQRFPQESVMTFSGTLGVKMRKNSKNRVLYIGLFISKETFDKMLQNPSIQAHFKAHPEQTPNPDDPHITLFWVGFDRLSNETKKTIKFLRGFIGKTYEFKVTGFANNNRITAFETIVVAPAIADSISAKYPHCTLGMRKKGGVTAFESVGVFSEIFEREEISK
jgi:hypothetical protein